MSNEEKQLLKWQRKIDELKRLHGLVSTHQTLLQSAVDPTPDQRLVSLVFETFSDALGEIPQGHRPDVFNLISTKSYKFLDRLDTS